jgi:hypothetical protein
MEQKSTAASAKEIHEVLYPEQRAPSRSLCPAWLECNRQKQLPTWGTAGLEMEQSDSDLVRFVARHRE